MTGPGWPDARGWIGLSVSPIMALLKQSGPSAILRAVSSVIVNAFDCQIRLPSVGHRPVCEDIKRSIPFLTYNNPATAIIGIAVVILILAALPNVDPAPIESGLIALAGVPVLALVFSRRLFPIAATASSRAVTQIRPNDAYVRSTGAHAAPSSMVMLTPVPLKHLQAAESFSCLVDQGSHSSIYSKKTYRDQGFAA